jgi:hypothetical protein
MRLFNKETPKSLDTGFESTAETEFERAIERSLGESIDSIRSTPLAEHFDRISKRPWKNTQLPSYVFFLKDLFPREKIITDEELERKLDRILR